MAKSSNGIMKIEGLSDTKGQCGLHRIIAHILAPYPVRENREEEPEEKQQYPRSRANSCGQWADRDNDLACRKEVGL